MHLERISVDELTDKEKRLIVKYCQQTPDDVTVESVVKRARTNQAAIYRFTGEAEGIFILAKGEDGLFLETVSGERIVENFDALYELILGTVMGLGVKRLYSYVQREGLKRFYERKTKAKPVATLYREELK